VRVACREPPSDQIPTALEINKPDIGAVASDAPVNADRALLPLNDPAVIAGWILEAR
jgi:hypothetical protein